MTRGPSPAVSASTPLAKVFTKTAREPHVSLRPPGPFLPSAVLWAPRAPPTCLPRTQSVTLGSSVCPLHMSQEVC